MENIKRDIPAFHLVYKRIHGLFVVIGSEGGGQPQSEGPGRRQGRSSRKSGIALYYACNALTAEYVVLKGLTLHGKGSFRHIFAADLEAHLSRAVDKYAIVPRGHEKRYGFVALLGAGAAVIVPNLNGLSVLDECGEFLAESVNVLAYRQPEHFTDKCAATAVRAGKEALLSLCGFCLLSVPLLLFYHGRGAPAGPCEQLSAVIVGYIPLSLFTADTYRRFTRYELRSAVGEPVDDRFEALVLVKCKRRLFFGSPRKMSYPDLYAVFESRSESNSQHRSAEGHAPV